MTTKEESIHSQDERDHSLLSYKDQNLPIFLKIYDQGSIPRLVRVEKIPAMIGRSLRSDIIIEDPGISGIHACLDYSEDGKLLFRDCNSKNGSWNGAEKINEILLAQNLSLALSRIKITFVIHDTSEETRNDAIATNSAKSWWFNAFSVLGILLGLYIVMLAGAAFQYFSQDWPPDRPTSLFADAFAIWSLFLGITIVLSAFHKLHANRYAFIDLFTILSLSCGFFLISEPLITIIIYNLRYELLRELTKLAWYLLIPIFGLAAIFKVIFPYRSKKSRSIYAFSIIFACFSIIKTYRYFSFTTGSRRLEDSEIGLPLFNPTWAFSSTSEVLEDVKKSFKVVDEYQKEDWDEILERDRAFEL